MTTAVRTTDGGSVLVLDQAHTAALRHLLNVTVGVGEVPVNSHLSPDELTGCLVVLSQMRQVAQ